MGRSRGHGFADDNAGPGCGLLQHLDRIVGRVAQVHRSEIELKLAGFHLREVEQVIDERQEKPAAGMDVVHIAAVLVILDFAEALKPHDFRESHDGIERRAQFMADAGKEFRFLPAGRLGHFLGLAQFRLRSASTG